MFAGVVAVLGLAVVAPLVGMAAFNHAPTFNTTEVLFQPYAVLAPGSAVRSIATSWSTTTTPVNFLCTDTVDIVNNTTSGMNNLTVTPYTLAAPTVPGTYDLYLKEYSDDACTNQIPSSPDALHLLTIY